ncbi:DUF1598 domain-containing protein [Mariniblastus fucicola]|uniref:DUF1598 domain-containing protein n=1 Tax=Mariniblastus fucicola TaxID=980251 RepID=A0A5B9PC94_9BACT|nr:DUF1598 domain-containing protein [Mariniblastus fucicola]QEG20731.1 hypothetical protein MFFC18_05820 [Mariniblastus fucicola]
MRAHSNRFFAFAIAALLMFGAASAYGQTDGGTDDGGDGDPVTGGVQIDANNVLTRRRVVANSDALSRERWKQAQVKLNKEIQKVSDLRKVSLVRLEKEVARLKAAGKPVNDDIRYLAGLTRITHVFFYPEENDIVIAGPAEGFFLNGQHRVVGMDSGKATLHLEDFVAALRAFGPDGKRASLISCSIDPTQEGLQRFQEAQRYVQANYRGLHQAREVAQTFYKAIGHQTITINGVSNETRFAQVLAEADYRMKLYGIGVEQPPVRMTTFIEAASPATGGAGKLQRWYFQPDYECVKVSEDRNSMALEGTGVKLVCEDESVSADGKRTRKSGANGASRKFCASFTKNYDKVAQRATVFGELRNLIDMSITAAYIQKSDLYRKANWDMTTFGSEDNFAIEVYPAPEKVAPVINAVVKQGRLMTPIGGGVNIQPRIALNSDKASVDADGKVESVRDSIKFENLADGQWWWD